VGFIFTIATAAFASPASTIPEPVVLPRPPFAYFYQGAKPPVPTVKLVKVSEKPNRITDVDRWFETNKIEWPAFETGPASQGTRVVLPPAIPRTYVGHRLIRAVISPPLVLAIYGADFSGGRYVVGFDPTRQVFAFAFDFKNYIAPPSYVPADREFVDEPVQWAQVAGGVLYVSNFHRTYARSSKGLNGYITAINPATSAVVWRSRPLVSNTANFIVAGAVLITGYGFTAEPDFLYLLNRASGAIHQTVPLRSGPEYLALKQTTLFVRAYNTDSVFRLQR
jgi:hypothetical protein